MALRQSRLSKSIVVFVCHWVFAIEPLISSCFVERSIPHSTTRREAIFYQMWYKMWFREFSWSFARLAALANRQPFFNSAQPRGHRAGTSESRVIAFWWNCSKRLISTLLKIAYFNSILICRVLYYLPEHKLFCLTIPEMITRYASCLV